MPFEMLRFKWQHFIRFAFYWFVQQMKDVAAFYCFSCSLCWIMQTVCMKCTLHWINGRCLADTWIFQFDLNMRTIRMLSLCLYLCLSVRNVMTLNIKKTVLYIGCCRSFFVAPQHFIAKQITASDLSTFDACVHFIDICTVHIKWDTQWPFI